MIEARAPEMFADTDTDTDQRCFVHCALLYESEREYLDVVARVVADSLARDEPVLVAVPGERLRLLHDAMAGARSASAAELRVCDITESARNPGRFLAMECSFVDQYPDRRVRIVSQLVWPGRSADECLACVQHEALVNGALGQRNVVGLCLYDVGRLAEDVVASARTTHPLLWRSGSAHRSPDYAPEDALARCNQPLAPNPAAVTYMVRKTADLRRARSFATDYGGWIGLSRDVVEDLQMVATELATNSLLYTGGSCQLGFWRQHEHVVCEARDGGRLDDPLAGRRPPGAGGTASRGLFLVNAMSDLVRTHTGANGTTIRAYLRLDPARRTTG